MTPFWERKEKKTGNTYFELLTVIIIGGGIFLCSSMYFCILQIWGSICVDFINSKRDFFLNKNICFPDAFILQTGNMYIKQRRCWLRERTARSKFLGQDLEAYSWLTKGIWSPTLKSAPWKPREMTHTSLSIFNSPSADCPSVIRKH